MNNIKLSLTVFTEGATLSCVKSSIRTKKGTLTETVKKPNTIKHVVNLTNECYNNFRSFCPQGFSRSEFSRMSKKQKLEVNLKCYAEYLYGANAKFEYVVFED